MARKLFPSWVPDSIKQITIDKYEDFSGRFPTAIEVRTVFLDSYGSMSFVSVRYVSGIINKLKNNMPKISDIDSPWSLGKSDEHRIPDEATGAILEMWAWSIKDMAAEPISIRVARWVSKLRWVPNAGGSPHGEVKDPAKLYLAAVMYSGRERIVELVKDKKGKTEKEKIGMRSGVLDAVTMLDPRLEKLARSLGILEDDTGINYGADLSTVAPQYQDALHAKYSNIHSLRVAAKDKALDKRLEKFGDSKQDARAMLGMAMKKLRDVAQYTKLSAFQIDYFTEELLQDMMVAYKKGDVYSWRPYAKIRTLISTKSDVT